MDNKDQLFIRTDLEELSGNTAYYRLPKELKTFINTCREKYGEIEAIILTKDEDLDEYDWNIGFVIPDKKEEEDE